MTDVPADAKGTEAARLEAIRQAQAQREEVAAVAAREKEEKRVKAAKRAEIVQKVNAARWDLARKDFQTLWVAGTVGAFFTALTINLPLDFQERTWTPDWPYTVDRLLRYGYLLWLLTYFFISNMANARMRNPQEWDIPYDVLQSFCALMAAFALGFAVPGAGFKPESYAWALVSPNVSIAIISLFALYWFRHSPPTEINRHRYVGLLTSLASMAIPLAHFDRATTLACFALTLLILWATLIWYIVLRLHMQPSEPEPATSPETL